MNRFRIPEIFLGCFLTVAVFAIGMLFGQRPNTQQATYQVSSTSTKSESKEKKPESEPWGRGWSWLSKDAAGFFTFGLVLVGIGQVVLFFWQLRYMREGMGDARDAADAAKVAAEAGKAQVAALISAERPFVFIEVTKNGVEHQDSRFSALTPHFAYILTNCGRTPAILLELKEEAVVVEGLADAPAALNPMSDPDRGILLPIGSVVPSNGSYREHGYDIQQRAADFQMLAKPDSWMYFRLFFRGFIRFKDTFGNYYVAGFQMIFSPQHNAWALRGGDEYNYCRQENPADIPPHPKYPGEKL